MYTLILIIYLIYSLYFTRKEYMEKYNDGYSYLDPSLNPNYKNLKGSLIHGFSVIPMCLLAIVATVVAWIGVLLIAILIIYGAYWIYQNMP